MVIRKKSSEILGRLLGMGVLVLLILFITFCFQLFDVQSWLMEFRFGILGYTTGSFLILLSDIFSPVPAGLVIFSNAMVLGYTGGFLLSMTSLICSALLGYFLARTGSGCIPLTRIKAAMNHFPAMNIYILILSKTVPGLAELVIFLCGIQRYDIRKFIFGNLLAYIPICTFYVILGKAGSSFQFLLFSLITLPSIAFFVFVILKIKRFVEQQIGKKTLYI